MVLSWGVIVMVVIFQPEIRMLLEKLGKTSVLTRLAALSSNEKEHLVEELVKACTQMSASKTGALISLEQGQDLSDYIKTGTSMNSIVSSELLCSIFQYGTPLHDGCGDHPRRTHRLCGRIFPTDHQGAADQLRRKASGGGGHQ